MKICEVTLKKAAKTDSKRPDILHRKLQVPELKSQVRLELSEVGLKTINDAGGLCKFLKDKDEAKLTPKLKKLRAQLVAKGKIKEAKPAEEKPAEEAAAPAEAPAEEAKAEEKPAEEKSE